MKQELTLKIEVGEENLWGQISYEDNLITAVEKEEEDLILKMKELLFEFHNLDSDTYNIKTEYRF